MSNEQKNETLYRGYINYRKLNDKTQLLKTDYFRKQTKEWVEKRIRQFQNPLEYLYIGKKVNKEPKEGSV
jgi:hypothetical protein